MIKPLIAVIGIGLLLGACHSPPQGLTARSPPSPSLAQAPPVVFFDWDKSNLSPQAMATISEAAACYRACGGTRITAVGNTDATGSTDYNMALSIRRADAVRSALIQNGVPAAAIETAGRGQANPLVATADGVREQQNRSVELAGLPGQASLGIMAAPVIGIVKARTGAPPTKLLSARFCGRILICRTWRARRWAATGTRRASRSGHASSRPSKLRRCAPSVSGSASSPNSP
jgi:hypothetical protein